MGTHEVGAHPLGLQDAGVEALDHWVVGGGF
jgi:hypothetical protein